MTESYLNKRIAEINRRFEILSVLHPLLKDLLERYGRHAVEGDDNLETPYVNLGQGWEVSLSRIESEGQIPDILESGREVNNPVDLFITPRYAGESEDELEVHYLQEDSQFWLSVGDNGAFDRQNHQELTADELAALLVDVQDIIQPGLVEARSIEQNIAIFRV
ncbi:MAG: hypothetical protein ABSB12_01835 [Candidatus Saccharimonadales bacterium]|jgi:hypothetical protein